MREKAVAPSQTGNNRSEIIARLQGMEDLIIEDITLDETQARVTLMKVPDTPGLAAWVFDEIAEEGIVVEMQSVGRGGFANLSFTVPQTDLKRPWKRRLAWLKGSAPAPSHCPAVAKAFGHRRRHAEPHGRSRPVVQSLGLRGINVDMINTSEVRVNVVVEGPEEGP